MILTRLAAIFCVVIFLTGCAGILSDRYVIPDQPTAAEQAWTADEQLRVAQRTPDPDEQAEEFRKAAAAFEKVVERFPKDRQYTPAAHLLEAEIYFRLEDFRRAERTYRDVIRLYPEVADVHVNALFGVAEAITARGKGAAGKDYYRQVIDIYGESDDPNIVRRVKMAKQRYDRILD